MDPLVSLPQTAPPAPPSPPPPSQPSGERRGHCKNKPKNARLSQARIEANRRNAQKSTGPRTAEGKAISRQNALKHGLSGAGVVVHPEDRERLRVRLDDWTRDLEPQDALEAWLVGRAALASVRLDRCAIHEHARLAERLETTRESWLERERRVADDFGRNLDTHPQATLRTLEGRAIGCEWLMAAWDRLAQSLQGRGSLTMAELTHAMRLLGQAGLPRATGPGLPTSLWAVGLALQPTLDCNELDRFRGKSTANLAPAERRAECRARLPQPAEARTLLAEMIQAERDRLAQRAKTLWTEVDTPLRQRALDQALFDPDEPTGSLSRYERANALELHRNLNLLFQKQRRDRQATQQRAELRSDVAREVLSLLRARRARRRHDEANGQTNGQAQGAPQAAAPGGPAAEPAAEAEAFVLPRPLSERMGEVLAAEMVAPAVAARENEPTVLHSDAATREASTHSGNLPGGAAPAASPAAGPA